MPITVSAWHSGRKGYRTKMSWDTWWHAVLKNKTDDGENIGTAIKRLIRDGLFHSRQIVTQCFSRAVGTPSRLAAEQEVFVLCKIVNMSLPLSGSGWIRLRPYMRRGRREIFYRWTKVTFSSLMPTGEFALKVFGHRKLLTLLQNFAINVSETWPSKIVTRIELFWTRSNTPCYPCTSLFLLSKTLWTFLKNVTCQGPSLLFSFLLTLTNFKNTEIAYRN